jgi:DNA-binding NarL/FixJ family response regulator
MTTHARAHAGKRQILIVDDHPIVLRGLQELLVREPDVEVCGGADNVADALRQVEASRPDLVVVDISLGESSGIDLIAEINARYAGVKTLVWSMYDEEVFAERALRAGAMGYVNKKEPVGNVVQAIRQVLRGEMYASPQVTNALLRRVGGRAPLDEDPIRTLSDRELQVFQMLGHGMTTKEIAAKLELSPKTVDSHRENIKSKLDVRHATDLNRRAVQWVLENG